METRGGWRTRGGWGTNFPGLKLLKFSRSGQVSSQSGGTGFNRSSNYHSKMAHYFCEAYRPAYRPHRPCRPTEFGLGRPGLLESLGVKVKWLKNYQENSYKQYLQIPEVFICTQLNEKAISYVNWLSFAGVVWWRRATTCTNLNLTTQIAIILCQDN